MIPDALKRCTEELEAARKELAAYGDAVSHDLRAPLRIIDGFSEALLDEYRHKLDDSGREYLDRIRSAALRLDEMISSLTELSRISAAELRREQVDISELSQAIAGTLRQRDPERNVEFSIDPSLIVSGDRTLLHIAFEHLLGNAWKFTSKHPAARIAVGEEHRDGSRVLFIRDDGAGFDPEFAGTLFGPFRRLHSPDEFQGVGIGLAIVRRIVHRHDGRVWATGAVERGATVYLELP